jgi:hypothetical protein
MRHQKSFRPEAKFMNVQFVEDPGHNLEVSAYNIYITNQFQTTFAHGVRGVKSVSRGDSE